MRFFYVALFFLFATLQAFPQDFVVKGLTADIYLDTAGYFDVVEKYDIEFSESKHGIYRDILTSYDVPEGGKDRKRKILVSDVEVPGHPFVVNPKWKQRLEDKVEIKIGDADVWVTGQQHYEIRYRVRNAFIFTDSLAQFYWNVKPADWQAVFLKVDFRVHVPAGATLSPKNCFVYSGDIGTSDPATDFDVRYQAGIFSGRSVTGFGSGYGQSVTLLVKLPRHLIREIDFAPPWWQEYAWAVILLALLLFFWRIWWKYGKDDKVIAATAYYPPKGIDPAMAGYLIDDKGDSIDLVSLIPYWASQGCIAIKEIPKKGLFGKPDMELVLLKAPEGGIPAYEQEMFTGLFGASGGTVSIGSLRNSFYTTMGKAKKELARAAARAYYVPASHIAMKVCMIAAIFLGMVLGAIFLVAFGPLAMFVAIIVCSFMAGMSFYLKKKNKNGNEALSELKGFRQFIKVAELGRIRMLLDEDPDYFEKTMSYALAFGLLGKWADKFNALNVPPPYWYSTDGANSANMYAFSRSFASGMETARSAMVSTPGGSSSGGGSSGGGFGGGGGRSW